MRIPYGFTLTNNGTLEINRSEADNVALVFDRLRLERQNGLVPR